MRSAIATNQQALLRDEPQPVPTPQPTTRTSRQQQAQQQAQPIPQSRSIREDTRNIREEEVEYTPPPPRVSHKLLPIPPLYFTNYTHAYIYIPLTLTVIAIYYIQL